MQFNALVDTNRANLIGLVDCGKIFTDNTTAMLGDGHRCGFVAAHRLQILLGYAAKVVPGDQLYFRPNVITNSARNSLAVRGGTFIDWPDSGAKPKVPPPPLFTLCTLQTLLSVFMGDSKRLEFCALAPAWSSQANPFCVPHSLFRSHPSADSSIRWSSQPRTGCPSARTW